MVYIASRIFSFKTVSSIYSSPVTISPALASSRSGDELLNSMDEEFLKAFWEGHVMMTKGRHMYGVLSIFDEKGVCIYRWMDVLVDNFEESLL